MICTFLIRCYCRRSTFQDAFGLVLVSLSLIRCTESVPTLLRGGGASIRSRFFLEHLSRLTRSY